MTLKDSQNVTPLATLCRNTANQLAYTSESYRALARLPNTKQERYTHMTHHHDHEHDHSHHRHTELSEEGLAEEQEQIAREIGGDITDAFVEYVLGNLAFEDLVFGVFDALSDLSVVASGEYELEEMDDEGDDLGDEA